MAGAQGAPAIVAASALEGFEAQQDRGQIRHATVFSRSKARRREGRHRGLPPAGAVAANLFPPVLKWSLDSSSDDKIRAKQKGYSISSCRQNCKGRINFHVLV